MPDQLEILKAQIQQLMQENMRLNGEIANRSLPFMANFTDAVNFMVAQARAGNTSALEQIKLLKGALKGVDELLGVGDRILVPPR